MLRLGLRFTIRRRVGVEDNEMEDKEKEETEKRSLHTTYKRKGDNFDSRCNHSTGKDN